MPPKRRTTHAAARPERLFGRAQDLAQAAALLEGGARLVTLTGPFGIGKSSVAQEAVGRVAPRFSGGVFRCELADASDLESALRCIRARVTERHRGSVHRGDEAVATLAADLGRRPDTLWVLDNADRVVGPVAALVGECLRADTRVSFVVTSREQLAIAGEQVLRLEPLGHAAGVALFLARADGGRRDEADLDRLIDHLDGIPLAIELAARRAQLVPPRELLSRLDERFRLLRSDRRDVAARQATLAATLEWSWEMLSADEALALGGLAAFDGPVTVEAFEAVLGPLLADDPIDVAAALLRKSLAIPVDATGPARITMLHTVRAFARERSSGIPGAERCLDSHARFYLERAEDAAARSYGREATRALDTLEADLPNLLVACNRALARSPERAARIALALGDLVLLRNVIDLRGGTFAAVCAAADGCDASVRVRMRVLQAKVVLEIGKPAEAEALLVEALHVAHEAALGDEQAAVRRSLGWTLLSLGRPEEARAVLDEALARYAVAPDARGEADALAARGLCLCLRGAIAQGHRELASAFAIHAAAEDTLRQEKVVEMAGVVGLDLGQSADPQAEARPADREAEALRLRASADANRASGRLWREAVDLFRLAALGSTARARGLDLDRARQASQDAGVSDAIVDALSGIAGPQPGGQGERRAPWVVGPGARWLRDPTGTQTDLTRHGSLRRLLDALVTSRVSAPGVALSADALLLAGWPGDRGRYDSGMLRVYSGVRRLRALGLARVPVTRDDGYLLDPDVPFDRS
jgi:predicted ATPase